MEYTLSNASFEMRLREKLVAATDNPVRNSSSPGNIWVMNIRILNGFIGYIWGRSTTAKPAFHGFFGLRI